MLTMKGQIECKRVVNWSAILRQVGPRLIRQGVLSGRLLRLGSGREISVGFEA